MKSTSSAGRFSRGCAQLPAFVFYFPHADGQLRGSEAGKWRCSPGGYLFGHHEISPERGHRMILPSYTARGTHSPSFPPNGFRFSFFCLHHPAQHIVHLSTSRPSFFQATANWLVVSIFRPFKRARIISSAVCLNVPRFP